jgi:hypothetical protein
VTVVCSPAGSQANPLPAGSQTRCTVTVTGQSPTGNVVWETGLGATAQAGFSSATCAVSGGTCSVTYTVPSCPPVCNSIVVYGTYQGDANNPAYTGTFTLVVSSPSSTSTSSSTTSPSSASSSSSTGTGTGLNPFYLYFLISVLLILAAIGLYRYFRGDDDDGEEGETDKAGAGENELFNASAEPPGKDTFMEDLEAAIASTAPPEEPPVPPTPAAPPTSAVPVSPPSPPAAPAPPTQGVPVPPSVSPRKQSDTKPDCECRLVDMKLGILQAKPAPPIEEQSRIVNESQTILPKGEHERPVYVTIYRPEVYVTFSITGKVITNRKSGFVNVEGPYHVQFTVSEGENKSIQKVDGYATLVPSEPCELGEIAINWESPDNKCELFKTHSTGDVHFDLDVTLWGSVNHCGGWAYYGGRKFGIEWSSGSVIQIQPK